MQDFYKSGRYFFAIAIIAFGIIQFVTSNFMSAFLPITQSNNSGIILLYGYSSLFVISGVTLLFNKTARAGSLLAFFLFFLSILYPHLFNLISNPQSVSEWTVMGETIAFCGGALIAVGMFSGNASARDRVLPLPKNKTTAGRILFAISLLICGIQHFMYAEYIAPLVPAWIPFREFWVYFVGVAFFAGFISLLFEIKTQLASALLGFMYLFWVLCLHAPRVITYRNKETEWTSMFIALGFCGIFFMLVSPNELKKTR